MWTQADLDAMVWVCSCKLDSLRKIAPRLRKQHLNNLLQKAKDNNDSVQEQRILNILRREAQRKRWRRVRYSTKPSRSRDLCEVKVPIEGPEGNEYEEYNTEGEVFQHVSEHLAERFRLAFAAPSYGGKLFDDLGFMGDTAAAQQILEGTYVYPPDTDPATRLLLEEAAVTYSKLSREDVASYVTVEDFQWYWKHANERVSSSYSGLHMGHYIAAAYDYNLSLLHASKLSMCARKGISLDRWGIGVTVLLEKICGVNYINKLRAICLFEADFNYWQKLIFAKRMMKQARESDLIPDENFATAGIRCDDAVMTKTFVCDGSKVLHHPMSLDEADFGDCFDRTAHGPKSIALQSWGIPVNAIRTLLTAIQTMRFCLRTGFGTSTETYGGSSDNPNAGSCQGSGSAGSAFSALSHLIVNAYKRMGHGAKLTSSYTARLFLLAAVMYVDDTDILHWAESQTTTDDELVAQVQQAQNDWGLLSQATGGILKPEKCSNYFLCYRFINGRARLKSLRQLPEPTDEVLVKNKDGSSYLAPSHITIPQPDGSSVPIATHDVSHASKMLGVHFAPIGDGTTHVKALCAKGSDWVDNLKTKPLARRDAWFSYRLQLCHGMSWGLVTVVMPIKKMDKLFQSFNFEALNPLGIHRNITTEYRMMPEMYGGLEMTNFVLRSFADKIFFLQRHWGFGGATASAMMFAYEAFLIEVGLYDNIFLLDYNQLSCLATDGTWFKQFWNLCSFYSVEFSVREDFHIKPVRENDRSIMGELATLGLDSSTLESCNIVRMSHDVVHMSDLTYMDGRTINRRHFSRNRTKSDDHIFPLQKPSRSDLERWQSSISLLASTSNVLPYSLGPYIREPHKHIHWRTDNEKSSLFHHREHLGVEMYDVYRPVEGTHQTRYGQRYEWSHSTIGSMPGTFYVSVIRESELIVRYHSHTAVPAQLNPPTDFETVLRSMPNQSLWKHFSYDDDGSWIHRGLIMGSLDIVHDGSYMSHVSTEVCSAAVMIRCSITQKQAKISVAEKSRCADNYRGEILGGLVIQLILRAASARRSSPYHPADIYCDNMGVISHGNDPSRPLQEKQSQADVLRSYKQLIIENPFDVRYHWVEGHARERKGWKNCTRHERMNDKVDELAKRALIAAYVSDDYVESVFPFEQIVVSTADEKITGSVRTALVRHWGYSYAKKFYNEKHIVSEQNFRLIWWDGLGLTLKSFPKMFRVWLTKHVSEFCGTNYQMSHWSDDHEPICPCCGIAIESTTHITRCQSPGRVAMLKLSVQNLCDWMIETAVDSFLVDMVEEYLLAQGMKTMSECLHCDNTDYQLLAEVCDKLTWDSFVEGRISTLWLEIMKPQLMDATYVYLSPTKWGQLFIERLLQLTHKQWIFRNSRKHYRRLDGLTEAEHIAIFNKMEELMFTDPDELLPRHRDLLETDFGRLGEGSSINRQYWIASMESALAAASLANSGNITHYNLERFNTRRRRRATRQRLSHSGSVVYRKTTCPSRGG